jgi:uncharacterized membrane protein
MIRRLSCLFSVLAVSLGSLAYGQPAYYDLGSAANVSGLSADGSVASGYITSGQFFYWTPSGGQVFVGGSAPGDGFGGSAVMSDDGAYFSGNTIDPSTQLSQMSRYHIPTGTWELLGGIGSSSGAEGSSGWGISGNGQSVVGLGWISGGTAHAIQWNPPGPTQDLGSTVAGNSSRANATNFDGSVVVGWQDGDMGRQAAIWDFGVQTLVVDGVGNPLGEASDISGNGNWVVGQGGFDEPWRLNRATGVVDKLGVLNPDAFFPSRGATGISDDGRIVVGFERDFANPFGGQFGTIWIEGQGIQDLTTWALARGVPVPENVFLTIPLAISADGKTISGLNSRFEGFVITVPEPGSIALALPALAFGLRRRRVN